MTPENSCNGQRMPASIQGRETWYTGGGGEHGCCRHCPERKSWAADVRCLRTIGEGVQSQSGAALDRSAQGSWRYPRPAEAGSPDPRGQLRSHHARHPATNRPQLAQTQLLSYSAIERPFTQRAPTVCCTGGATDGGATGLVERRGEGRR